MKTQILRLATIIVAAMTLLPSTGASSTTTLLSQDFSSSTFPPTGWNANLLYSGGNSAGWQWSSGGLNGSNGSAVGNTSQALDYHCYGSSYGPLTLTTPTINGLVIGDTQYLDFDLYMPCNYYEYYSTSYYNSAMGATFSVLEGSTTVMSATTGGSVNYGDATFYDGTYAYANDPSGYPSSAYWRHYHVKLPTGQTSLSLTFKKDMAYSSCYYYLWYDDDVAFDNVVITNIHPIAISVIGPKTLNFGSVPYLQTAGPYFAKIADSTNRAFTISNYAISGPNASDFSISRAPSSLTAFGGSDFFDSIGVTYTPHTAGTENATLTAQVNDDASTVITIQLTGIGLRPYISVQTLLKPLFAHVLVRFGDTAFATLLVSNTGKVPLHISPSSFLNGDFPQMYSIQRLPPAIGPDQTDSLILAFAPTREGILTASLNIVSDASNGTQVVPMAGVGILARLTLNNAYQNNIAMNFDSVAVGTDSCFQVTLFNPGSDTLAIEKNFFSSADYDFSMTPLTGSDTLIAPGAARTIPVCFHPLKRGYRTAELRIVTNIPRTYQSPRQDTSQFTVFFVGTGVPAGNFFITGPDMVDSVDIGKTDCQTDTLWNTGGADLTVTQLTVDNSSEFTITPPTLPFVLAAGSYRTFSVCGTPSMMNDRTAIVTGIAMNGERLDTATNPQDVFGISHCTSDSVTTAFPAMTCIGDTAIQTVMVTNCGNVATSYSAAITGPNASDFTIVGSATTPIESGGNSATYTIAFHPTTNAAENAMLNITGGAGAALILTANGSAAAIAGSGTAPMTAVGSSNNFTVTVNNTGSCDWTPGTPQVAAPFSYVSGGTTPITAGGSSMLTFSFAPTSAGNFTQPVTFPNSTGMSIPAANVTLSGATGSAGVREVASENGYRLDQNYPNPFASTSQVEITLPESANVRLVLVDMKGEVVQSILDQHMGAGSYEVKLDASNLASGAYYYQMTAGSVTLTRQMEVVK